jgi:sec-independent protein translocase protein TatA
MGISVWQLLIVLAIVLVVFGAKRLRGLGGDLGSAVKSFREAVRDPGGEADATKTSQLEHDKGQVGESEAERGDARDKEKQQV